MNFFEGMIKTDDLTVKKIDYPTAKYFTLKYHYLNRFPTSKWNYGLFKKNELIGVCVFSKPASNSLCEGVCGKENKEFVWELSRLVINIKQKNLCSYFISRCLNNLPKNLIIISYADEGQNHNGYIYQASNFLYTGKTKERTDKYTPNGKHSRHYIKGDVEVYRKVRSAKHRYIYFTGKNKKWIKLLKYEMMEYPKNKNYDYVLGEKQKDVIVKKDAN